MAGSSIYGYYSSSIGSGGSRGRSLGISGLASGMDIDSVVKAMSSGTSSKISKVQQNLMKLQWEQEAYQDVGKAMTDFKEKYLSGSGESNINKLLNSSYKIDAKGTNSNAVSASGSADILENFSILGVSNLASSTSFTSSQPVTGSTIYSEGINFSDDPQKVSTLKGESLNIKIGSESYSLKLDDTLITDDQSMLQAINNAIDASDGLNTKLRASLDGGKLKLESLNGSSNITISPGNRTLVLRTFGLQADDKGHYKNGLSVTGNAPNFAGTTKDVSFFNTLTEGKSEMTLDLNGSKATIKFTKEMVDDIKNAGAGKDGDEKYSAMLDSFVSGGQNQVDKYYNGKVRVTSEKTDNADGTKNYSFGLTATDSHSTLSVASASSGLTGSGGAIGLNVSDANRLLTSKALEDSNFKNKFDFGPDGSRTYDLSVNGVNFTIGKNKISVDGKETEYKNGVNIKNVMGAINGSSAKVNMQYLSTTDRFMINSSESGSSGQVELSGSFADMLFGDGQVNFNATDKKYESNGSGTIGKGVSNGNGTFTAGADAELLVSFDGNSATKITRASNNFTIDGLNVNLKNTFNADKAESDYASPLSIKEASGAVTFSKTVDDETLKKTMKEMVKDYNDIITKVSKYYTTKPDRDFQALTPDMIKDEKLSDDQAKLYNDKAKEGLLFGSNILGSLMDDLNRVFTGLSSVGISTSKDYREYGKLSFDEVKFSSSLETDNSKLKNLFNQDKTGVFDKLDGMMKKYVNSSLVSPGLITREAGLASSNLSQINSNIYSRRASLEKELKSLNTRLSDQQDRYYKRFTKMEKLISQYQSQSSYLGKM